VIRGLASLGARTELISTGQHRELVQDILGAFELTLDHDLKLMRADQTLDHVMVNSLAGVGQLLDVLGPPALVVQGDTTTALAAALAAFHRSIPVAHVEAGLRSGRLDLPFPEEMNRRLLSTIARWHFAPTDRAVENLRRENISEGVHLVGNTVVDSLLYMSARRHPLPRLIARFVRGRPYIVATAHRRESWGAPIREISQGLRELLRRNSEVVLVFVTHPNPRAHAPVDEELGSVARVLVVDALDYQSFITLLSGARLAITDSGGVQEEAPTLGVPTLVTREVTERQEGIEAGAAILVGTNSARIVDAGVQILENRSTQQAMSRAGRTLYGDGKAGARISEVLIREIGL
jgi:UDP-N-acetylglucosamine 2-epimerase (non-hydrolysing)